jgi:hypothetical protein
VTVSFFSLVVFSVACSVTGQIFFKHAMSDQSMSTRPRRRLDLAGGVLVMTVGFFSWLALLRRFDLSYLYPFEGNGASMKPPTLSRPAGKLFLLFLIHFGRHLTITHLFGFGA